MTFDDLVITKYNIMLFNNLNNYEKSVAVDYIHSNFKNIITSWRFLKKWSDKLLTNHIGDPYMKNCSSLIVRLPSCSNENFDDYYIYLKRLQHTLWRRSHIELMQLHTDSLLVLGKTPSKQSQAQQPSGVNPMELNWNKECDITTLYGPDLSSSIPWDDIKYELMHDFNGDLTDLIDAFNINPVPPMHYKSILKPHILKTTPAERKTHLGSVRTHRVKHEVKFNESVQERSYSYSQNRYCQTDIEINDLYTYTVSNENSLPLYYYY